MKKLLSKFICVALVLTIFTSASCTAYATKASKVKKKLTGKKWYCVECIENGESKSPFMEYGSWIRETGAYIKFKKNNKFECSLGFVGCSGTYKVKKNGKVTLHLKKEWDARDMRKTNKIKKLKIYGNYKSIAFKLNGVKNRFSKNI